MKITRIATVFLLGILLVSGLACQLFGDEPAPTNSAPSKPSAPTLTYPADGAILSGISVTFQWQASAGANTYYFRVSKDPNLVFDTAFLNAEVVGATNYTLTSLPRGGDVYYWGVYAGNSNWNPTLWSPKKEVLSNSQSFMRLGGASLAPKYEFSTEQISFSLTAWAKEPSDLYIYDPLGNQLAVFYVPPEVEADKITETIPLPPVPYGGTYKLEMYSEITGEMVWQGEQTFEGPKMEIIPGWSLNPRWVRGVGWDLQYLTMQLKNAGDMPFILDGLKLRLDLDGSSTQEVTIARKGDVEAEYGWTRTTGPKVGIIWGVNPGTIATIVPWNSENQNLFGQRFLPGEYVLHLTLSDQPHVLEVKELLFEPN